MNVLFVCSRNQWRSPTAETIYKDLPNHTIKSAGTEPSARIRITARLIDWADIIFVMEKRHKERITDRFTDIIKSKQVIILDIADDYQYMEPELIDTLKVSVSPYLEDSVE